MPLGTVLNSSAAGRSQQHLLPDLPYHHASLEPHIDAQTMLLHHDKHHGSYVAKLNLAVDAFPQLYGRSAEWLLLNLKEVPATIRTAVRNNAGGHVNHSLLWRLMSPAGGGMPAGSLADAIERDFGSLAKLRARFDESGATLFGSGWVWLVRAQRDGGKLQVCTTSGHDNPLMKGRFPILVNDVWEHAYYLKHGNRRGDYLQSWWNVVNWAEAANRFEHSDQAAERCWEDDGGLILETTI